MGDTSFLDCDERADIISQAELRSYRELLAALHRGEVVLLGKPVRLAWPDGEPPLFERWITD